MSIKKNPIVTSFQFNYFTVKIEQYKSKIMMEMIVSPHLVSTAHIPCVIRVLKRELPGVFTTKCFNYSKHSFLKEAARTELGHLFEHILLEQLSDIKTQFGFNNFTINGLTTWNWYKYPRGTFHITIDVSVRERLMFYRALAKSVKIYDSIIENCLADHHINHSMLRPPHTTKSRELVNNLA
jgi:hypothetical protein